MSARKSRQIKQSLTNKGFKETNNDHHYFHLYNNGEKTNIVTKISHGQKECGDDRLSQMARQLRLNRKDFDSLIDCTLGEEAYKRMLKDNGDL
jgi:hypothetical protein